MLLCPTDACLTVAQLMPFVCLLSELFGRAGVWVQLWAGKQSHGDQSTSFFQQVEVPFGCSPSNFIARKSRVFMVGHVAYKLFEEHRLQRTVSDIAAERVCIDSGCVLRRQVCDRRRTGSSRKGKDSVETDAVHWRREWWQDSHTSCLELFDVQR